MRLVPGVLAALLAIFVSITPVQAAFHFMQIDQVIGGVNGDTTAQAIQLRMRSSGQNIVSSTRLKAFDATGSNPILLKDMTSNVTNGAGGARILLTTLNFANYTNIPLMSNFTLDNPIPASYLAAGSLTFEDDFGTILWRLSWGGAGYTGSNLGSFTNDSDGNFGPPFPGALPSTTLQALDFTGAASALSTNNAAQYVVTPGAATFINNAGTSFVVTPAVTPPGLDGDFNDDDVVDAADYVVWRQNLGTDFNLNGNGDENGASAGVVDQADYDWWQANFGDTSPGGGAVAGMPIPEPSAVVLVILTVMSLTTHRRRIA